MDRAALKEQISTLASQLRDSASWDVIPVEMKMKLQPFLGPTFKTPEEGFSQLAKDNAQLNELKWQASPVGFPASQLAGAINKGINAISGNLPENIYNAAGYTVYPNVMSEAAAGIGEGLGFVTPGGLPMKVMTAAPLNAISNPLMRYAAQGAAGAAVVPPTQADYPDPVERAKAWGLNTAVGGAFGVAARGIEKGLEGGAGLLRKFREMRKPAEPVTLDMFDPNAKAPGEIPQNFTPRADVATDATQEGLKITPWDGIKQINAAQPEPFKPWKSIGMDEAAYNQQVHFPKAQGEMNFLHNNQDLTGIPSEAFVPGISSKPKHAFGYGVKGVQEVMPEGFQWAGDKQGEFDFLRTLSKGRPSEAFTIGNKKGYRGKPRLGKPTAGEQLEMPVTSEPGRGGQDQFNFLRSVQESKGLPVEAYDGAPFVQEQTPVSYKQREFDFPPKPVPMSPEVQAIVSRRKADGNVVNKNIQPKVVSTIQEVPETPAPLPAPKNTKIDIKARLKQLNEQKARQLSPVDERRRLWDLEEAYKTAESPAARAKIAESIAGIKKNISASKKPTAIDDIKTVVDGIKVKSRGLGSMGGNIRVSMTPEAKAAMERLVKDHGSKLAEDAALAGKELTTLLRERYPAMSPTAAKVVAQEIGKVGNLNVSHMPEDTQKKITEMFKGSEESLVSPKLTREQLDEQRKNIFTNPITEQVLKKPKGQQAGELLNRQDVFISKARALNELSTKDPELFEKTAQILADEVIGIQKIKSEAGYTLGAAGIDVEGDKALLDAYKRIVKQMNDDPKNKTRLATILDTLKKVDGTALSAPTKSDLYRYVLSNSMTSGILTQLAGPTSGIGYVATRPLVTFFEGVSDNTRRALLKLPLRDLGAEFKAVTTALKEGASGKKLPADLKSKSYSDKYGVSPIQKSAALAKTKGGQKALEVTDAIVGAPSRGMEAFDKPIKNLAGLMEKASLDVQGVPSTSAIYKRLIQDAQLRATFQDAMSELGGAFAQMRDMPRKGFVGRSIGNILYTAQPFIKTVDRIISKAASMHPGVGLTRMAFKGATGRYRGSMSHDLEARLQGGAEFDRDIANLVVGLPVYLAALSMYKNGIITGKASDDPDQRAADEAAGWLPYSIKIGGTYRPMRLLPEPLSTAMQFTTTLFESAQEAQEKELGAVATATKKAIDLFGMLMAKPYMSGLNSLFSSSSSSGNEVGDLTGTPSAKKFASALVPSVVKDVAVTIRSSMREPRPMIDDVWDVLKSRTPGIKTVGSVDILGDPALHQNRGKVRNEPEYKLLREVPLPIPDRRIWGNKISKEDYLELSTRLGQGRKALYKTLANNPSFMSRTIGEKRLVIQQALPAVDALVTKEISAVKQIVDPEYANKKIRTLLDIKKPNTKDAGIFPFSRPSLSY